MLALPIDSCGRVLCLPPWGAGRYRRTDQCRARVGFLRCNLHQIHPVPGTSEGSGSWFPSGSHFRTRHHFLPLRQSLPPNPHITPIEPPSPLTPEGESGEPLPADPSQNGTGRISRPVRNPEPKPTTQGEAHPVPGGTEANRPAPSAAESQPDQGELLPAEPVSKPKSKRIQPRNELFDALATACGHNLAELTEAASAGIGKALADIRKASPNVTAQEVTGRVESYRRINPTWPCTPNAIAKNWSLLSAKPETAVAAIAEDRKRAFR